jgi:hypothetical protein
MEKKLKKNFKIGYFKRKWEKNFAFFKHFDFRKEEKSLSIFKHSVDLRKIERGTAHLRNYEIFRKGTKTENPQRKMHKKLYEDTAKREIFTATKKISTLVSEKKEKFTK